MQEEMTNKYCPECGELTLIDTRSKHADMICSICGIVIRVMELPIKYRSIGGIV